MKAEYSTESLVVLAISLACNAILMLSSPKLVVLAFILAFFVSSFATNYWESTGRTLANAWNSSINLIKMVLIICAISWAYYHTIISATTIVVCVNIYSMCLLWPLTEIDRRKVIVKRLEQCDFESVEKHQQPLVASSVIPSQRSAPESQLIEVNKIESFQDQHVWSRIEKIDKPKPYGFKRDSAKWQEQNKLSLTRTKSESPRETFLRWKPLVRSAVEPEFPAIQPPEVIKFPLELMEQKLSLPPASVVRPIQIDRSRRLKRKLSELEGDASILAGYLSAKDALRPHVLEPKPKKVTIREEPDVTIFQPLSPEATPAVPPANIAPSGSGDSIGVGGGIGGGGGGATGFVFGGLSSGSAANASTAVSDASTNGASTTSSFSNNLPSFTTTIGGFNASTSSLANTAIDTPFSIPNTTTTFTTGIVPPLTGIVDNSTIPKVKLDLGRPPPSPSTKINSQVPFGIAFSPPGSNFTIPSIPNSTINYLATPGSGFSGGSGFNAGVSNKKSTKKK